MLDTLSVHDPVTGVRAGAAKALAGMDKKKLVHALLNRLSVEEEAQVQLQLLRALEILDGWKVRDITHSRFKIDGGEEMLPEERLPFRRRIKAIYESAENDNLHRQAEELLELVVARIVQEGNKLSMKADLAGGRRPWNGHKDSASGASAHTQRGIRRFCVQGGGSS